MAPSETVESPSQARRLSQAAQPTASQSAEQFTAPKVGKGKQPEETKLRNQHAKDAALQKADGEAKLSAKDMKAKKQAEKQARRSAEKIAREGGVGGGVSAVNGHSGPSRQEGSQAQGDVQARQRQGAQQPQRGGIESRTQHRRAGSQSQAPRPLPLRRRPSQTGTKEPRKVNKEVGLFGHLYSQPRRYTTDGVSKEVHPAVLALGFQMSSYVICGSNARCVAMLLAFKQAIESYTTPPNNSLARHLTSHYLSPQIDYLKSHRPISVSMGNAIRWLKDYIIQIDPDVEERVAKTDICEAIDTFIRERITVADTAISSTASSKIRNGSTVVTFAKSSIVERALLDSHNKGTRFKVIVIDSRPLFEGKNLARTLASAGIETQYMLLAGAAHAVRGADLVLLGAHAMMANGRLYSRVGTASVAMLAHSRDVPVIVCCESIKFTDRVALDSIVLNEIAPPDELLLPSEQHSHHEETSANEKATKGGTAKGADVEKESGIGGGLGKWRDVPGLQLLNILYDVTPAEFVDMVITEYGSLPPTSVPVVHRISTERDVRA